MIHFLTHVAGLWAGAGAFLAFWPLLGATVGILRGHERGNFEVGLRLTIMGSSLVALAGICIVGLLWPFLVPSELTGLLNLQEHTATLFLLLWVSLGVFSWGYAIGYACNRVKVTIGSLAWLMAVFVALI